MPLPITQKQAFTVAEWIKSNFRSAIDKAVKGTPFSTDILCGIACQESAYFWLPLLKRLSAKEILARCVLDANGDYPGTKRSLFPTNTGRLPKPIWRPIRDDFDLGTERKAKPP